jgi:hypothetical protein
VGSDDGKEDPRRFFVKVIYSDECCFEAKQCGRTYLRGPRGYRFSEKYIKEKKKIRYRQKSDGLGNYI